MKKKSASKSPSKMAEATLWAHVKPRSSRNRIRGWNPEGFLEIQTKALPEGGAANRACVQEIARALGIPRNQVFLEKGLTARHKKFRVQGISEAEVRLRLEKSAGIKEKFAKSEKTE